MGGQPQPPAHAALDALVRALLVGLLLAAGALMCLRHAGDCVADADLGWHLQTGSWILQHHAVPHVDPFSRVVGGRPWQAYSWLFDLLLLQAWTRFGLQGVVLLTAGLMMLITAAVYRLISHLQSDFTVRILLTLAAVFCISKMSMPRPWLFTVLLFVLELDVLMRTRETGRSRSLLWLPPIFALWANVHIQFIDGLLVLAIAACEPLLLHAWKSDVRCARARSLWLAWAACVLATLLNPYGLGLYRAAWDLGSQSGVLNSLSEMGALPFRSPDDFVLLFLAMAAAGVLFRYRRLPPFETLLLAMAVVLSFRSRRDVWITAISAAAILGAGLPARRGTNDKAPAWAQGCSAVTALIAMTLSVVGLHLSSARLQALLAEKMPLRAVEFIRASHAPGPVFNPYDWGGFLIWQLQEPVSIDGRAALYGDALIDRSLSTWNGGPSWAADPALRSARVVIAPKGTPLVQLLRGDPRFAVAWQDPVAVVLTARPFAGTGSAPGSSPAPCSPSLVQPLRAH